MRLLMLGAVLLTAGCATTAGEAPEGPAEYRTGYAGGCNSGYVAAGHPYYQFTKDVTRYASDPLYKQGWDDGFAVCKGGYESIGRSLR